MRKISRACLFVVSIFLLTTSLSYAQQKIRTVEHGKYRKYDTNTEPIAIVSRELGDKPFMNDSDVVGGSDWLRVLTLSVKNISKKAIKECEINLIIAKQGNMSNDASMSIRFPTREPVMNADGKPTGEYQPLKLLKPGEIIKVKVSENQLRMLDVLKKDGVSDVDQVSLVFISVKFDDGKRWFQGIDMREDPNNPGRWVPVRPDRPGPTLGQRFSKWLSSFTIINAVSQPLDQFVFIFPAKSRFSFASANMPAAVLPMTPPGCGWLDQVFDNFCDQTHGVCATAPPGGCVYDVHLTFPDDPGGGTFGGVATQISYWCHPVTGSGGECNIDTGGCGAFPKTVWFTNPTCGQPTPTPTPTPSPTPPIASCPLAIPQFPDGNCAYGYHPDPNGSVYCCPNFISGGCEEYIACGNGMQYNYISCRCARTSPIIVDILGNGYNLTSSNDGVSFDFNGDAVTEIAAWTSAGSDDAFLVLDRNNNGTVDNGQELFGNFTPQARIVDPNGFLALALYDLPENGGNGDGRINQNDAIFPQLRLWQDANHNGVSEPNELHTLPELGLRTLDLDYRESRRTDQYGNRFRYRARVRDSNGAQLGRWAWDVYLVTSP